MKKGDKKNLAAGEWGHVLEAHDTGVGEWGHVLEAHDTGVGEWGHVLEAHDTGVGEWGHVLEAHDTGGGKLISNLTVPGTSNETKYTFCANSVTGPAGREPHNEEEIHTGYTKGSWVGI